MKEKICVQCNTVNPENAKFCIECGGRDFETKEETLRCGEITDYELRPQIDAETEKELRAQIRAEVEKELRAEWERRERHTAPDIAHERKWGNSSVLQDGKKIAAFVKDIERKKSKPILHISGKSEEQNYRNRFRLAQIWYGDRVGKERYLAPASKSEIAQWFRMGDKAYFDENYVEAVIWYVKAAEQGHAEAQYSLGVCYYSGQGVAKDYKQAVYWYGKAAEQGHMLAQNNLGVRYDSGQGVEKDYTQAVFWYRKAAKQGYMAAQYNLGICYEYGRGIEQDYAQAAAWYGKAAAQGDEDAKKALERLRHMGKI